LPVVDTTVRPLTKLSAGDAEAAAAE
jgi:hypothetical protein